MNAYALLAEAAPAPLRAWMTAHRLQVAGKIAAAARRAASPTPRRAETRAPSTPKRHDILIWNPFTQQYESLGIRPSYAAAMRDSKTLETKYQRQWDAFAPYFYLGNVRPWVREVKAGDRVPKFDKDTLTLIGEVARGKLTDAAAIRERYHDIERRKGFVARRDRT